MLREPVGSWDGGRGPVARLRSLANALGTGWPYLSAELFADADSPEQQAMQVVEPALPLAVCVLVLGYTPEFVEALLPRGASAREAVLAVAEARLDFRGRVFPYIVLPGWQPSMRWLLAIAFPSWAVHDCFVVFNLLALDGRLFVEATPLVFDRACVLRLARLPDLAEVDVYVDGAPEPLTPQDQVQAFTGQSLVFCPRGSQAPAGYQLGQVLGHADRALHPVVLPVPAGRHFCIVTDSGHRLLSFGEAAEVPSPWYIPVIMGFPAQTRVCVLGPDASEVAIAGFECAAVIALVEEGAATVGGPFACAVDCRGLLQGWSLETFGETGIPAAPFRDHLETFMPPHWQLLLEGVREEVGFLRCHDGQVIWASFVPEPDATAGAFLVENSDSEEQTSDTIVSPASSRESSPDTRDPDRQTRTSNRSRSPRRSMPPNVDACTFEGASASASPRFSTRRKDKSWGMSGCFGWLFVSTFYRQFGLSTAASSTVGADLLSCDRIRHDSPSRAWTNGRGAVPRCLPCRPLPTPCRARRPLSRGLPLEISCLGPTLLEQVVAASGDLVFFDARCLLEVLFEHFAVAASPAASLAASPPSNRTSDHGPRTLQLADLIPRSSPGFLPVQPDESAEGPNLPVQARGDLCRAPDSAPEIFELDVGQCLLPCAEADFHAVTTSVPFHLLGAPLRTSMSRRMSGCG